MNKRSRAIEIDEDCKSVIMAVEKELEEARHKSLNLNSELDIKPLSEWEELGQQCLTSSRKGDEYVDRFGDRLKKSFVKLQNLIKKYWDAPPDSYAGKIEYLALCSAIKYAWLRADVDSTFDHILLKDYSQRCLKHHDKPYPIDELGAYYMRYIAGYSMIALTLLSKSGQEIDEGLLRDIASILSSMRFSDPDAELFRTTAGLLISNFIASNEFKYMFQKNYFEILGEIPEGGKIDEQELESIMSSIIPSKELVTDIFDYEKISSSADARKEALRYLYELDLYSILIHFNFEREKVRHGFKELLSKPSEISLAHQPFLSLIVGKRDEAISLAESNIKKFSKGKDLAFTYMLLGDINFYEEKFDKSTQLYNRSYTALPRPHILVNEFFSILASGKSTKRLQIIIDDLTSEWYEEIIPKMLQGFLSYHKKNYDDAYDEFKEVRDSEFNIPIFCNYYLSDYMKPGKGNIIYLKDTNTTSYLMLAEISIIRGNYAEAIKFEYQVLSESSNHFLALGRLAQLFENLPGHEEDALNFKRKSEKRRRDFNKLSSLKTPTNGNWKGTFKMRSGPGPYPAYYTLDPNFLRKYERLFQKLKPESKVLILGETGVGKEVMARNIHSAVHGEGNKPLVTVNCAGLPTDLIESELFGYEKGAFTGALKDGKMGLVEAANGSTLFLDEIAELPLSAQAKLLRVLDSGYLRKVSSNKEIKVKFLLICATNKVLNKMVAEEKFREDLYYRIEGGLTIRIPPLRDRPEDIEFLLRIYAQDEDIIERFDDEAIDYICKLHLPGNVRQLQNLIDKLSLEDPPKIDSNVIRNLLSTSGSTETESKSQISAQNIERMDIWFRNDFKRKSDLLTTLKRFPNPIKDKRTLNKQLSSAFLEIGKVCKWLDLECIVDLCVIEGVLPEEKVEIFKERFLKHMKKLKTLDENDDNLISQWIYPDDTRNFKEFRNSKPKWVN